MPPGALQSVKDEIVLCKVNGNKYVHMVEAFNSNRFGSATASAASRAGSPWSTCYPTIGRFISQDPICVAGGTNEFAYFFSPLTSTDPLGLAPKTPSQFALPDGAGASPADTAASKIGGGNRKGRQACHDDLIEDADLNNNGVYVCWRCGHSSLNASDMHLDHSNVPTSKGGNLAAVNVKWKCASCNFSARNSGYAKEGMSCV